MHPCTFCKKPCDDHVNYCGWDCMLGEAQASGGVAHQPNGLPIGSIKHDGSMWEHEHGDHPDYMFPVEVEYAGEITSGDVIDFAAVHGRAPEDDDEVRRSRGETHALIYGDGNIAVTMHECCYALWELHDGGKVAAGQLWKKAEWKLSDESLKKIMGLKEAYSA